LALAVLTLSVATVAEEPAVVVMIVPEGQERDAEPVVRAVDSQLSDLRVELRLHSSSSHPSDLPGQVAIAGQVAAEQGALVVCWYDLIARRQVFLYLTGADQDRILVRKLEEPEDAGRAEAIAIIIRSSVNEILAGGVIGIAAASVAPAPPPAPLPTAAPSAPPPTVPEQEPPMPEEPPPPTPEERDRLLLDLGYVLHVHSSAQPVTHGLGVALGVRLHPSWMLLAGYTVLGRIRGAGESATVVLSRHPIHLAARLAFDLGMVDLGATLALVLDYATFEVRRAAEELDVVDDHDDLIVAVVPSFDLRARLVGGLHLLIGLGVEIPLHDVHYVVQGPAGPETLLDSWPVQPRLLAGFELAVF
jgi:hypothetical protein